MALKHRPLDVEIDGLKLQNRIVEPSRLLSDDPHLSIVITQEVFEHLLAKIQDDREIIFPFKATRDGFMLESEVKIESIGYNSEDAHYFVSVLLL